MSGEGNNESSSPSADEEERHRLYPPQLLAEALAKPSEGALVGKPTPLLQAVSRASERTQQLKITQAYWRLATAEAGYHWSLKQRDALADYTHEHTNHAATLAARAAARADVRDAQLVVAQAQQDLLDLMNAPADEELPLATDRPHVGGYNTRYEVIFASRTPPPRIRLIHRVLPVRRKAIDAHGAAIVAAMDALESAGDEFRKSGQGLSTVLVAWEQLQHERRAFLSMVRDYNQEYAEYLFAVLPPNVEAQTLVSYLILNSERGASRKSGQPDGQHEAPDHDGADAGIRSHAPEVRRSLERVARFAPAVDESAPESGLFGGLRDVKDAVRVQKLSNWLHLEPNLPRETGQPASLGQCLGGVSPNARLDLVVAYWRAREQVARYKAAHDNLERLNALATYAIHWNNEPGMDAAGVRLQAARRGAMATINDTHLALIAAQFELTQRVGRLDDAWLWPATAPQAGSYGVAPAGNSTENRQAHHWGRMVHLEHEKLKQRGSAVVEADVNRTEWVNLTREGPHEQAAAGEAMALDHALRAIATQSALANAFLHDVTAYNVAIARYVTAVMPGASGSDLLRKLVIARNDKPRS